MKLIPLTQGKFAMVDDEDYALISRFKWRAAWNKRGWRAVTNSINSKGKRGCIGMQRMIIPGPEEVDHIDLDGLNNTKSNLRKSTRQQNMGNTRKRLVRTTSQYKGVSQSLSYSKKWQVYCGRSPGNYVGTFSSEIEVAHAYDKAAIKRFGEFARINFPCQSTSHHQKTRSALA